MMKKLLAALLAASLMVMFSLGVALAEEKKAEQPGFWQKMKTKVQGFAPDKSKKVTTAVGGVRGAKDDSANTLYWKGESKDAAVGAEELEKFNIALQLAIDGKNEESKKQFEEFMAKYPKSTLKEDAAKAIEEIKKTEAKAAPAPEEPKK